MTKDDARLIASAVVADGVRSVAAEFDMDEDDVREAARRGACARSWND